MKRIWYDAVLVVFTLKTRELLVKVSTLESSGALRADLTGEKA